MVGNRKLRSIPPDSIAGNPRWQFWYEEAIADHPFQGEGGRRGLPTIRFMPTGVGAGLPTIPSSRQPGTACIAHLGLRPRPRRGAFPGVGRLGTHLALPQVPHHFRWDAQ